MPAGRSEPPGLAARRIAADILDGVLRRRRPLDEQLDDTAAHRDFAALADRDRALVRKLVTSVLRRLGTLRHLLGRMLERGLPADAPRVETALLLGAAQILWLEVPDHAAVDLAVRLCRADRRAARYAGLVNAVLRRVTRDGSYARRHRRRDARHAGLADGALGRRATAPTPRAPSPSPTASEPALDLTVKSDPEHWAEKLGGRVLPTGSVRAIVHGPVSQLPGYGEGAWWVQDAAAALPARLLGNVSGRTVADLCAAPGGKTAQLAAAGASVVAVDRAPARLERLRQNLDRLQLTAELVAADVTAVAGGPVRRGAARCALLVDRDHPPPSRHSLAQARGRHCRTRRAAAPAARPRRRADQAGRNAGLLHVLARAGGRRRRRPRSPRQPARACADSRSRRTRCRASG